MKIDHSPGRARYGARLTLRLPASLYTTLQTFLAGTNSNATRQPKAASDIVRLALAQYLGAEEEAPSDRLA